MKRIYRIGLLSKASMTSATEMASRFCKLIEMGLMGNTDALVLSLQLPPTVIVEELTQDTIRVTVIPPTPDKQTKVVYVGKCEKLLERSVGREHLGYSFELDGWNFNLYFNP